METRLTSMFVLISLLILSLVFVPIALAQGPATAEPGFFGGGGQTPGTPQPPASTELQAQQPEAVTSAEQEPNDHFSETNSIAPSGTVAATISPKGDTDWYKVVFPSPGVLDVVIPGVPADGAADGVSIRLFNDNADVVYDWSGPVRKGEPTMPIWDITKAGVYYFQVAENYSDATVTYSLQTKFTPAPDAGEPNDAFSKAIPIQPNTPIQS